MTNSDQNPTSAPSDFDKQAGSGKQDPQTAQEASPDGQFQDQDMPTTDGEPGNPDPNPTGADGPDAPPSDRAEQKAGEALPQTTDDHGRPLDNPSGG